MQSDYSSFLKFKDSLKLDKAAEQLIETALTHPSYASEHGMTHLDSYERLEFLGDAVLKLLASDFLFKKFPDYNEGELSNLRSFVVSDETLTKAASDIGLDSLIKTACNDKTLARCNSINACAFEAILGALFLAGKYEELKKFFGYHFSKIIDNTDKNIILCNPKALLQEYTQKESKELPEYEAVEEIGAAHEKTFVVRVRYAGKSLAKGTGKTKKAAQQDAALKACKKLGLLEACNNDAGESK